MPDMTANQEILLIKNGELALKGLNRGTFEAVLMKNLRHRLAPIGDFRLRKAQSTIYIEPIGGKADLDEACARIAKVFGLAAFSRARMVEKDMDTIQQAAVDYLAGNPFSPRAPSRWRPGAATKASRSAPRLSARR